MNFRRSLLISCVLHGLCTIAFWYKPAPVMHPPAPIEVQILAPKKHKKIPKFRLSSPRIGSTAYKYTKRSLGTTLASEHYLERLHAHIDPNWRYFVQQARQQQVCTTVLNIDADSKGTVVEVVVVATTCSPKLKQAAIDAIWYANLLPPPSIFLDKTGLLKLEWTFSLKHKD